MALLGYYIGHNEMLLKEYLHTIIITILVLLLVAVLFYIRVQIKKGIIIPNKRKKGK
ncbi:MAG: hypothetical protein GX118_03905 [Arcobacter butzleri]|nr:hypothetical protein [Aliarcobacter butzleri]